MTAQPNIRMSVDEFLAWAEGREGRYELVNGKVLAMAPENLGHVDTKVEVHLALRRAILNRERPCHAVGDGATVRIDKWTTFEPDAMVYCGPKHPNTTVEVPNPVIVVEVLSPSTRHVDLSRKLSGYFRVPSIRHYVIVDHEQKLLIHHERGECETILTRILREGTLVLDPPGLTMAVADMFSQP